MPVLCCPVSWGRSQDQAMSPGLSLVFLVRWLSGLGHSASNLGPLRLLSFLSLLYQK